MNHKVDVQHSIFNHIGDGTESIKNVENFVEDLRDLLIKHNVKTLRSDFMELDKDGVLVIRGSEFVGNKRVEMTVENRRDIGTNIHFVNTENKYKAAFEKINKENQKYRKLAEMLKDVLEID